MSRTVHCALLVLVGARIAVGCASPLTVAEVRDASEIETAAEASPPSFGDDVAAPSDDSGDEAPFVADPVDADDAGEG